MFIKWEQRQLHINWMGGGGGGGVATSITCPISHIRNPIFVMATAISSCVRVCTTCKTVKLQHHEPFPDANIALGLTGLGKSRDARSRNSPLAEHRVLSTNHLYIVKGLWRMLIADRSVPSHMCKRPLCMRKGRYVILRLRHTKLLLLKHYHYNGAYFSCCIPSLKCTILLIHSIKLTPPAFAITIPHPTRLMDSWFINMRLIAVPYHQCMIAFSS